MLYLFVLFNLPISVFKEVKISKKFLLLICWIC